MLYDLVVFVEFINFVGLSSFRRTRRFRGTCSKLQIVPTAASFPLSLPSSFFSASFFFCFLVFSCRFRRTCNLQDLQRIVDCFNDCFFSSSSSFFFFFLLSSSASLSSLVDFVEFVIYRTCTELQIISTVASFPLLLLLLSLLLLPRLL